MAVKKKKAAPKKVKKAKVVAKKVAKKKAVAKKVAKKVVAKKTAKKKVVAKKAAKKKPVAKKKAVVKKTSKTKPVKTNKVKEVKNSKAVKSSGAQSRYTDKDLQEFKKLIQDKLEASRKELKYLHEQINRTAELGSDDSDSKFAGLEDGTGTSEKEYLNQMASRQIQYIDNLERALVRIANRTYGVCRVTGKLISKERLRAVPHATLSIEAKKAQSAGV